MAGGERQGSKGDSVKAAGEAREEEEGLLRGRLFALQQCILS